jgi:hypothetical protein
VLTFNRRKMTPADDDSQRNRNCGLSCSFLISPGVDAVKSRIGYSVAFASAVEPAPGRYRPIRMQVPIAGAFATATLLLAACGGGSSTADLTSPSPTPSASVGTVSAVPKRVRPTPGASTTRPSPVPTYAGARQLTESDSGATVRLSIGESVRVSVPAEYDPPAATGNALARSATSGGYPTRRPVDAIFTAVRGGRADITTSTDYPCLHATPSCLIAQSLWVVHVIVVAQ